MTLFTGALSACASRPLFGTITDGCTPSGFGLSCARCSVHPAIFLFLGSLTILAFRAVTNRFAASKEVTRKSVEYLSALESAIVSKDVEYDAVQVAASAAHRISDTLRTSCDEVKLELSAKAADVAELKDRSKKLEAALEDATKRLSVDTNSQVLILEHEVETKTARLAELASEVAGYKDALEAARKQLNEARTVEARVLAAEQKASAFETQAAQLQNDRVGLEGRYATAAEQLQAAKADLAEIRHERDNANNASARAREDLIANVHELHDTKTELAAARSKTDALEAQLSAAKESLFKAQQDRAVAESEVATIRELMKNAPGPVAPASDHDDIVGRMTAQVVDATNKATALQHQLLAAEASLADSRAALAESKELVAESKAALAAEKTALLELKAELGAAKRASEAALAAEELARAELDDEVSALRADLQHAARELDVGKKAAQESAAQISELHESLREAAAQCAEADEAARAAEAQRRVLEDELAQANTDCTSLEEVASAAELRSEDLTTQLAAAQRRCEELSAGLEAARRDADGKEDVYAGLRARVVMLEEQNASLASAHDSDLAQMQLVIAKEQELLSQVHALAEDVAHERASTRALRDENTRLKEEIDAQRDDVIKHKAAGERLAGDVAQLKTVLAEERRLRHDFVMRSTQTPLKAAQTSVTNVNYTHNNTSTTQRYVNASVRQPLEPLPEPSAGLTAAHGAGVAVHIHTQGASSLPPHQQQLLQNYSLNAHALETSVARAAAHNLNTSRLFNPSAAADTSSALAKPPLAPVAAQVAGGPQIFVNETDISHIAAATASAEGGFLSPMLKDRKHSSHMLFSPSPSDAVRYVSRLPAGAHAGPGALQHDIEGVNVTAMQEAGAAFVGELTARSRAVHDVVRASLGSATPAVAAAPAAYATPASFALPAAYATPATAALDAGAENRSPPIKAEPNEPGTIGIRVEDMPAAPAVLRGRDIYGGTPAGGRSDAIESLSVMAAPEPGLTGVRISVVLPNSFALNAGLQEGDVLLSLNARRVSTQEMFVDAKRSLRPGMEVPIVVRRGQSIHTKYVFIGKKGETSLVRPSDNRGRVRPALGTERDAYPA